MRLHVCSVFVPMLLAYWCVLAKVSAALVQHFPGPISVYIANTRCVSTYGYDGRVNGEVKLF